MNGNTNKHNNDRENIILLILSDINQLYVDAIAAALKQIFKRHVEIRYEKQDLKYAQNKRRQQYSSPSILSRLRRIKKGRGDIILAVVNVDLFTEGYDFVYGEAEVGSGAATLSISRLVNENINTTIDTNQAAERVIREAIHEAGHLYGLGHCPNPRCVMRTCTCLEEVDEATGRLCDYCKQQLVPNAPK